MNFLRTVPATVLAGALGICLMGAANENVTTGDFTFAPSAMSVLLQSVANAEAVQDGGASGDVASLAKTIQSDELSMGTQLASLSGYYGINVNTDLPKANASSASFAKDQVTAINKLIAICNAEKTEGNASQLRTLADSMLPILQKDLSAAQAAAK